MAVEKIYQPYQDVSQTSIPKQQPQAEPRRQTVKEK